MALRGATAALVPVHTATAARHHLAQRYAVGSVEKLTKEEDCRSRWEVGTWREGRGGRHNSWPITTPTWRPRQEKPSPHGGQSKLLAVHTQEQ